MRKVEKLAAVIVLILLAFVYGHVHKTHAIYDRMIENDQYVMLDVIAGVRYRRSLSVRRRHWMESR